MYTKLVVLQNEEGYRMINGSHIVKMDGDLSLIEPPVAAKQVVPSQVDKKEADSLNEAHRRMQSINPAVSDDIQSLFIILEKILSDVHWRGLDICIMGNFIITANSGYCHVDLLEGSKETRGGPNHIRMQDVVSYSTFLYLFLFAIGNHICSLL